MEGFPLQYWEELNNKSKRPVLTKPWEETVPTPLNATANNTELVRSLYQLMHPAVSPSDLVGLSTAALLYRCVDTARQRSIEGEAASLDLVRHLRRRLAESIADCHYWILKASEYGMALGAAGAVLGAKASGDGTALGVFDAILARSKDSGTDTEACLRRILESYGTASPAPQAPVSEAAAMVEDLVIHAYSRCEELSRQKNIHEHTLAEYERAVRAVWDEAPRARDILRKIERLGRGEIVEDDSPNPTAPMSDISPAAYLLEELSAALPQGVVGLSGFTPNIMRSIGMCVGELQATLARNSAVPRQVYDLTTLDGIVEGARVAAAVISPPAIDPSLYPHLRTLKTPTEEGEALTSAFLRAALQERNSREDHAWGSIRSALDMHESAGPDEVVDAIGELQLKISDAHAFRFQVERVMVNLPAQPGSPVLERTPGSLITELESRIQTLRGTSGTLVAPPKSLSSSPARQPPPVPSTDNTLFEIVQWVNDRFVKEVVSPSLDCAAWWRAKSPILQRVTATTDMTVLQRIYTKLCGDDSTGTVAHHGVGAADLLLMIEEEVEALQSHAMDCTTVINMIRDQLPECVEGLCSAYSVLSKDAIRYEIPQDETEVVRQPLDMLRATIPRLTQKAKNITSRLREVEGSIDSVVASISWHLGLENHVNQPQNRTPTIESVAQRLHSLTQCLVERQQEVRRRSLEEKSSSAIPEGTSLLPKSPPPAQRSLSQRSHEQHQDLPSVSPPRGEATSPTIPRRVQSLVSGLLQVPYFALQPQTQPGLMMTPDAAAPRDMLSQIETLLLKFSVQYKQAVIFLEQDMDSLHSNLIDMITMMADNVSLREMGVDRDVLGSLVQKLSRKAPYFQKRSHEQSDAIAAIRAIRVIVQHIVEASRIWVERASKLQDSLSTTCDRMKVSMPDSVNNSMSEAAPEALAPYLAARVGSQLDSLRRQRDASDSELAVLRVKHREVNASLDFQKSDPKVEQKINEMKAYCRTLRDALSAKKAENRALREVQKDLQNRLASKISSTTTKIPASPMGVSAANARRSAETPGGPAMSLPVSNWVDISPSRANSASRRPTTTRSHSVTDVRKSSPQPVPATSRNSPRPVPPLPFGRRSDKKTDRMSFRI